MSDRSDYSFPDDDDDLPVEQDHQSYDEDDEEEDDHFSSGSASEDVESAENVSAVKARDIDASKLVLCTKHQAGHMVPEACNICASNLSIISDQDVVKKLTAKTSSSLVSKYSGRCDVMEPTLKLSDDTIQLALGIYTKGVFNDTRHWVEIIRKFLTIPPEKHELLNADIQYEDVLNRFKKEQRFQGIFRIASELAKCIKNLRISTRPVLSLMEMVNADMEKVRALGQSNGIVFPDAESAPIRTTGANVPRNGRTIRDSLHYSDAKDLFNDLIPDLSEFYEELSENSASKLHDVLGEFKANIGKEYLKLFDLTASSLNVSEDQLIFFSE